MIQILFASLCAALVMLLNQKPVESSALENKCLPAPAASEQALAVALNSRDERKILSAVQKLAPDTRAAAPEVSETFHKPSARAYKRSLSADDIDTAISLYLDQIERKSWWLSDTQIHPSDSPAALRAPAEMIRGLVAIAKSDQQHRTRAIQLAHKAADYLVQASKEAGVDYAPFPYWRGKGGRLGRRSEQVARKLKACGMLEQSVVNGWFVVEEAAEQYLFDTGLVGEALAELNHMAPREHYAEWIMNASEWIADQPLSSNFNYNAFPANFHADAFKATGEPTYLDLALDGLIHGVIPGMIQSGRDAGHWIDPHNARIVYRVIMVRALVETRLAMTVRPHNHKEGAAQLDAAISASLGALERQMRQGGGITSPGVMVEIYLVIEELRKAGLTFAVASDVKKAVFATAAQAVHKRDISVSASLGIYLAALSRTE